MCETYWTGFKALPVTIFPVNRSRAVWAELFKPSYVY
jgi:hypothetical protein